MARAMGTRRTVVEKKEKKIGRGNVIRATVAAVMLALVLFGVLVFYAPDSEAFSPNNYGWNGIHDVSSVYDVHFTTALSAVPSGSVLVIMQPSFNFTRADVEAVRVHLDDGGTVLVADKSGFANSLLTDLGSGITIESQYSIADPIYNWKAKTLPTALVESGAAELPFAGNITGIALDQPSPLVLQSAQAFGVAVTSQFSYSTSQSGPLSSAYSFSSSTSSPSLITADGPFIVAAGERVGHGLLVVVSDSQLLLNSEWTIADNRALIGGMFGNSSVFIDASHWSVNPVTSSTAQLRAKLGQTYQVLSETPLRYILTLSFVVVCLALVPAEDGYDGNNPGGEEATTSEHRILNKKVLEQGIGERRVHADNAE
jgi:hypothetical protein